MIVRLRITVSHGVGIFPLSTTKVSSRERSHSRSKAGIRRRADFLTALLNAAYDRDI